MNESGAWSIALAVLASVGGGGALVLLLSSWLGKVWASRLMARETAEHSQELASLRAALEQEINRASHLFREKLELYKEAGAPLINLMTALQGSDAFSREAEIEFERSRLASTALLAMFAPKEVFDCYNEIVDYLYECFEEKRSFAFPEFRTKALRMLSHMRRDVGLYSDEVTYSGDR